MSTFEFTPEMVKSVEVVKCALETSLGMPVTNHMAIQFALNAVIKSNRMPYEIVFKKPEMNFYQFQEHQKNALTRTDFTVRQMNTIIEFLQGNQKIQAVKYVRNIFEIPLVTAKELVDRLDDMTLVKQ